MPIDTAKDPFQWGNGLINFGHQTRVGCRKTAFLEATESLPASATRITLASVPVNWQVGDELLFPDTAQPAAARAARVPPLGRGDVGRHRERPPPGLILAIPRDGAFQTLLEGGADLGLSQPGVDRHEDSADAHEGVHRQHKARAVWGEDPDVLAMGDAAFAAPAEGSVRGAGAAGAVKDSYIVVLKDRAADAGKVRGTAEALVRRYGGTVRQSFASTVRGFSVRMTEAQAKRLAGYPDVAYVEQDRAVSLTGTQTNPPSWGLDRIDQRNITDYVNRCRNAGD